MIPEIPRHLRRRPPWGGKYLLDKAKQRTVEIFRTESCERAVLFFDNRVTDGIVAQHGIDDRGHLERVVRRVEHAGAVHGGGHRSRRVGHHRYLFVEGLHDWHAETFMGAGAKKEVRNVVVRRELGIGDMSGELHARCAQIGDELVQHREIFVVAGV